MDAISGLTAIYVTSVVPTMRCSVNPNGLLNIVALLSNVQQPPFGTSGQEGFWSGASASCSNGVAAYSALGASFTPRAGDVIRASVVFLGGLVQVSVRDAMTGQGGSTSQNPGSTWAPQRG